MCFGTQLICYPTHCGSIVRSRVQCWLPRYTNPICSTFKPPIANSVPRRGNTCAACFRYAFNNTHAFTHLPARLAPHQQNASIDLIMLTCWIMHLSHSVTSRGAKSTTGSTTYATARIHLWTRQTLVRCCCCCCGGFFCRSYRSYPSCWHQYCLFFRKM
jgi:hypothetical protein